MSNKKIKFRRKQGYRLSLLFTGFSLFIFGTGYMIGDIPLEWVVLMTIVFSVGSYIIGGFHDPNDPNPQD